jgi:hypothetical protein
MTHVQKHVRVKALRRVAVGSVALSTALLAGCGGMASTSDHAMSTTTTATTTTTTQSPAMGGMSGMDMGDASLPHATSIAGAQVRTASFVLLASRPPGTDGVKGTAWVARSDTSGTTVTLELTGLTPGATYLAHLHAKACSDGNGGPHFQFQAGGPAMPPNEVHLAFSADGSGRGFMTAHNERNVGSAAAAVVVHPTEAMDNRLACADI